MGCVLFCLTAIVASFKGNFLRAIVIGPIGFSFLLAVYAVLSLAQEDRGILT
jgi:hypothetical protein